MIPNSAISVIVLLISSVVSYLMVWQLKEEPREDRIFIFFMLTFVWSIVLTVVLSSFDYFGVV